MTGEVTFDAPSNGEASAGADVAQFAAGATTLVVTEALSLACDGSDVVVETRAVFVTVLALCGAVVSMVADALAPFASTATVQVIVEADEEHAIPLPLAATSVTPAGRTSVTVTPVALAGPRLVTVMPYCSALPVVTETGADFEMDTSAWVAALIVTLRVVVVEHVPMVTVTRSVTLPTAPAEKVMPLVAVPEVMLPLVADHAYVAPGSNGTLASCRLLLALTDDGAVIGATGAGLFVIMALPDDVQLPLVTTTCRTTSPEAAASNVIASVPAPPVMVPLVMLHA